MHVWTTCSLLLGLCQYLGPCSRALEQVKGRPCGSAKGTYSARTCLSLFMPGLAKESMKLSAPRDPGENQGHLLVLLPFLLLFKTLGQFNTRYKKQGERVLKLCVPSYPLYLCRCLVCFFLHYFSFNLIVVLPICSE